MFPREREWRRSDAKSRDAMSFPTYFPTGRWGVGCSEAKQGIKRNFPGGKSADSGLVAGGAGETDCCPTQELL